jgi:hypothetical protein
VNHVFIRGQYNTDIRNIDCEDMNWIEVAQDSGQWLTSEDGNRPSRHLKTETFWISCTTINCSRNTMHSEVSCYFILLSHCDEDIGSDARRRRAEIPSAPYIRHYTTTPKTLLHRGLPMQSSWTVFALNQTELWGQPARGANGTGRPASGGQTTLHASPVRGQIVTATVYWSTSL